MLKIRRPQEKSNAGTQLCGCKQNHPNVIYIGKKWKPHWPTRGRKLRCPCWTERWVAVAARVTETVQPSRKMLPLDTEVLPGKKLA